MAYSFQTTVTYDKPFLSVHWDNVHKIVVMEWKSFVSGDLFREGLNTGLNLVIEKRTHRWLADLRKIGVVSQEDQKWSNEDWFPRAIQGGIQRMALLIPESALAKMSVNTIMSKVGDTLVSRYFSSPEEARAWLAEG